MDAKVAVWAVRIYAVLIVLVYGGFLLNQFIAEFNRPTVCVAQFQIGMADECPQPSSSERFSKAFTSTRYLAATLIVALCSGILLLTYRHSFSRWLASVLLLFGSYCTPFLVYKDWLSLWRSEYIVFSRPFLNALAAIVAGMLLILILLFGFYLLLFNKDVKALFNKTVESKSPEVKS